MSTLPLHSHSTNAPNLRHGTAISSPPPLPHPSLWRAHRNRSIHTRIRIRLRPRPRESRLGENLFLFQLGDGVMAVKTMLLHYLYPYDSSSLTTATFLLTLLIFHISELLLVYTYERSSLSFRSLLLSPAYLAAMALSVSEYTLSLSYLFPLTKRALLSYLYMPGLCGVVAGEVIRKVAWCTAKLSFSHDIRTKRVHDHSLVTHGVYAWCRHPAYFGWFVWALSTQILLANPLSFACFGFATWSFFKNRIPFEEAHLVRFFGADYIRYRAKTPTRIPGIP